MDQNITTIIDRQVNSNYWMSLNSIFLFHFVTRCVGTFGGKKYYKKHGIDCEKD